MSDLIQHTEFANPDMPIETVDGMLTWDEYLHTLRRTMRKNGRQAKIKKTKGKLALYVDKVTG